VSPSISLARQRWDPPLCIPSKAAQSMRKGKIRHHEDTEPLRHEHVTFTSTTENAVEGITGTLTRPSACGSANVRRSAANGPKTSFGSRHGKQYRYANDKVSCVANNCAWCVYSHKTKLLTSLATSRALKSLPSESTPLAQAPATQLAVMCTQGVFSLISKPKST
jgi:hypothetical protein